MNDIFKTFLLLGTCQLLATDKTVEKEDKTSDHTHVTNCVADSDNPKKFYADERIQFTPIQSQSNRIDDIRFYSWEYTLYVLVGSSKFRWAHIKQFVKPIVQKVREFVAERLEPRRYLLDVKAIRISQDDLGPGNIPIKCYFDVVSFPPVAIISGGSWRTVPANKPILLNGEESYEINAGRRTNKTLNFLWTCDQKRAPATFCTNESVSTKSRFIIPAFMVKEGDEFEVTLKVEIRNAYGPRENSTSAKIIVEYAQAARLMISCLKNCAPVSVISNYQEITYATVKCTENCKGIRRNYYKWFIEDEDHKEIDFNYKNHTRFGRTGSKFVVKRNVFKEGIYFLTVDLISGNDILGYATMKLVFKPPPNVTHCSIKPEQGEALYTDFQLVCDQKPENEKNLYALIAKDVTGKRLIMQQYYPQIQNETFKLPLPAKTRLFVRVKKRFHPYIDLDVKVNVRSSLEGKSGKETVKALQNMYDGYPPRESISEMVGRKSAKERQRGLKLLQAVVNEIVENSDKSKEVANFVEDFQYRVLEDMLKAPFLSVDEMLMATQTLVQLTSLNLSGNSSPQLAKFVTTFCKKIVDRYLEMMKKETLPVNLAYYAKQITFTISRCMSIHSKPNFDVIKPVKLNITTEKSVFDYPVATENYPNYEDHNEKYYQNMDWLKEATFNRISASAKIAKITAMTTAIGEGLTELEGEGQSTVVAKDIGTELANSTIKSGTITLIPSQDFANDEHPYDILMITWTSDIFWWNPNRTKVITNILSCEFWHSTCTQRVVSFKKPFKIRFETVKNVSETWKHILAVPKDYSSMSVEELNYQIRVHRIALARGSTLFIKFFNMSSSDMFDVVVIANKFPEVEDFTNKVDITNSESITLTNDKDYDINSYVGILIKKEVASEGEDLRYEVSFTVKSCVRWITASSRWKPTCKTGAKSNDFVIECECNHSSIIAGYLQNVESSIQHIMKPDIELELQATFIIFVTLVITLSTFFLLLLSILFQQKTQIYFLGDNNTKHRFIYLIEAKTGTGFKSGTSSNVIIKLIGDKKTSEPHLLNYPDPKKRILQEFGNDMFLLTTETHLGNLEKIHLWADSEGQSPAWYCKEIKVYDLQQRTESYFDVRKRLSLIKGVTEVVVEASSQTDSETVENGYLHKLKGHLCKFRARLLLRNRERGCKYHTWCLCHKEENFTYVNKLTVILSTILSTYALALLLYGVPTLELKDGIDKQYQFGVYDVFVAFASSCPVFMFHTAVAWCFRFCKVQVSRYEQDATLPFGFTIFCWLQLLTLVTISTAFLIVFGFWVSVNSSWIWLTACTIGICFDIFVYESIFVLTYNFLSKLEMSSIWTKVGDIWRVAEIQRKYLYEQFGEQLLRPYFEHLYHPLKMKEIKAISRRLEHRYQVISDFEDLVMFLIYMIILYVVILLNKDSLIVRGKITMEEIMEGKHTRTTNFHKVDTIYDVYAFINATLLLSIHPRKWYGNYTASEPALMIDMANKYMGVARIRQHRMMSDVCEVPQVMRFLNMTCYPEFTLGLTETKTFGYKWGETSPFLLFDRLRAIWTYSTEQKAATFATLGEFSAYSGGGYVALLGRTLYNSYVNFRKLSQKLWINSETRVVFIEFLTYNANCNIFSSTRLTFEKSASGFIYKTVNTHTVRMLFVHNKVEKTSAVFFFLFAFWVGTLFFKESIEVMRKFRTFYKDIWLVIEIIIILLSIACLVLFSIRMTFIGRYLSYLEKAKNNEFQSYFFIFYMENVLMLTAALVLCAGTIRLWKFLRFGPMFRTLEKTIAVASAPLLTLSVPVLLMLLTSSMTLLMTVGNQFEKIYSLGRTVRLMVTIYLQPEEMDMQDFLPYRVATFTLVIHIVVLEITAMAFAIIIVKAYFDSQLLFSSETESYTIKHYVQERVKYFSKFMKYRCSRLRGGQIQTKVYPKSDKFLYMNSFSVGMPRMRAMEYIAESVLRNKKRHIKPSFLSDNDADVMLGVCRIFLPKEKQRDEVDVFYKGRIRGERIRFVDERRIENIANVVNLLLQEHEDITFEGDLDTELEQCLGRIRTKLTTLQRCFLNLKLALCQINNFELRSQKIMARVKVHTPK